MNLTPRQKLASIKPGAIQLWAPYALEMAISGKEPPLTPGQRKVLDERKNLLHLATTAGSWNHQQMLWALGLWLDDDSEDKTYTIDYWNSYLQLQLGDWYIRPTSQLSFWGGSESNSAGYEHMRWGCVCAVDLWARKLKTGNGEHNNTLANLCQRYHRTQVAMCWLLPTAVSERSGEHGDPLHLEMWKLAESRQPKRKWKREIDWPMRLAMQAWPARAEPMEDPEDYARPLFSEIRCAYWTDGTHVYWLPERKNFNTPCYLIEIQRPGGHQALAYPWQRGRGFNDKRLGWVRLVGGRGWQQLQWVVGANESRGMGEVDLPAGTPYRCYAIGQQGYVEGDWSAWLRGE